MKDRAVTHDNIFTERGGIAIPEMHYGAVLQVAAGPHRDAVHISAQHAAKPDADPAVQHHIAHQGGAGREVDRLGVDLGQGLAVALEDHAGEARAQVFEAAQQGWQLRRRSGGEVDGVGEGAAGQEVSPVVASGTWDASTTDCSEPLP